MLIINGKSPGPVQTKYYLNYRKHHRNRSLIAVPLSYIMTSIIIDTYQIIALGA